jgi:hypothetical protein
MNRVGGETVNVIIKRREDIDMVLFCNCLIVGGIAPTTVELGKEALPTLSR